MDRKQLRQLLAAARAAGWRVDETRRHIVLYPTDPNLAPITVARTASDWRAGKNIITMCRRAGLPI
jgi:hypothetical protein